MYLAKISKAPVLALVLFSFNLSFLCACPTSFCLWQDSWHASFPFPVAAATAASNISFTSASFQMHAWQSKWHFSAELSQTSPLATWSWSQWVLAVLSQEKLIYWPLLCSCDDHSGYWDVGPVCGSYWPLVLLSFPPHPPKPFWLDGSQVPFDAFCPEQWSLNFLLFLLGFRMRKNVSGQTFPNGVSQETKRIFGCVVFLPNQFSNAI